MNAYDYTALDPRGRTTRGVVEADSPRAARQVLKQKNLLPMNLEPTRRVAGKPRFVFSDRRLGATRLALVTRQLATLLKAGIPLEESLASIARHARHPATRRLLLDLTARIREGQALAQALDAHGDDFSSLYRATVAAGERSGCLDLVLEHLAEHTEHADQFKRQLSLALIYPALLTLLSLLIVGGMLMYVVPDMLAVITDAGQSLPLATRALLAISDIAANCGLWLVLAMLLTALATRALLRQRQIRRAWHRLVLHTWPAQHFSRTLNSSRYGATLGILLGSGVSLSEAMPISEAVCPNLWFRDTLEVARQRVLEGRSLHGALEQTGYFSPMMLQLVASGERSGALAEMISHAARNQETEMRQRVSMLVSLFEPGVLVVMGGLVLFIVLAVLLPILNLNQLVY